MRWDYLVICVVAAALSIAVNCQAQDWATYTTANSSLEHNQVQCVCGDAAGRIWIGLTYNGMHLLSGTSWQFFSSDNSGLAGNYVRKIVIDDDDVKWIANHRGLSSFDDDAWQWTTFSTSTSDIVNNSVKDVAIDPSGILWIATSGGVSRFDGATFTNYTTSNSSLPSNDIKAIAAASNGDIWVGTNSDGAALLRSGVWQAVTPENCPIAGHEIRDVMVDRNQHVWFACYDGEAVSVFDGTNWTSYSELNSDLQGRPVCLAQHSNGSVWVGTDDNGIFMLQGGVWTVWNSPAEDGIGSVAIRDVAFDSQGNAWAATLGGLSYMEIESSSDIEVSIYTSKSTYTAGETIEVRADACNNGTADAYGSFYITSLWPDGTLVYWWMGTTDPIPIPLTLNAGLVVQAYLLHSTQIDTMFMQRGAYTWTVAYVEEGTGTVLASDSTSFAIQ